MARRSLKPQLNQIRTWVRQGRTDAWIAHQLEVSVRDIDAFKREHELTPAEATETSGSDVFEPPIDEPDLRAEDDALVAAALDAEPEASEEDDESEGEGEGEGDGEGDGDAGTRRRRRGRRGGRGRRRGARKPLEGTFDHGDEGYGLWLDPSIQDDAVYAEYWAGHRPVTISVEQDQIVIRRAGEASEDDEEEEPASDSLDPDRFDA